MRDVEGDFMTDAEEETCYSTTAEDISDEDDSSSLVSSDVGSETDGLELTNIAFQMHDRYVV